jgi:mRNA interferase MazF
LGEKEPIQMSRLQQGAVVWANLPEPAGRRPVVILTRDSAIRHLNALTVAPVTRTIRRTATEVILEPADGVPTICAVTLDSIFTIQRSALDEVIVVVSREKLLRIFKALRTAFDMP